MLSCFFVIIAQMCGKCKVAGLGIWVRSSGGAPPTQSEAAEAYAKRLQWVPCPLQTRRVDGSVVRTPMASKPPPAGTERTRKLRGRAGRIRTSSGSGC